jgi:hypothetical protein
LQKLFILVIVLVFSFVIIPVYASKISFSTDKSAYLSGDSIKINGEIQSYEKGQFASLQILNPHGSDFAAVDMFVPKNDGSFSRIYQADGPKWAIEGKYEIKIFYKGEYTSKFVQVSKLTETPQKQESEIQQTIPKEQPTTKKVIIDTSKSTIIAKTKVPGFPDFEKSPKYYFERYENEPEFKKWFDSTFPDLTINDVVGYPVSRIPDYPDNEQSPSYYLERYSSENDYREWFETVFPGMSIYQVLGFPEPVPIPSWIKNNAKWWSEGKIDDANFISGIQFLIQNRIILISDVTISATSSDDSIPSWVRNTAKWWSEDLISETDFLNGLEYLIERGVIHL